MSADSSKEPFYFKRCRLVDHLEAVDLVMITFPLETKPF